MSITFRRNLAIVVGINDYQHGVPMLKTPVHDAQTVAEILQTQHDYKTAVLLDQNATRAVLVELLEQALPKQVEASDRLLFYFAGHGIALNGEDGPEGYLIPQDARLGDVSTYLPMSWVHQALLQLPCRHFLGILDCCFAGAFRWSSTRKLVPLDVGTLHKERFDRFIQDPAWQVITSAAYDQFALDAFNLHDERGPAGGHSPFAAALIEALQGQADAYPPAAPGKPVGDGVITATELYLYLRDRIEPVTDARAIRQTPGIHPLKKHDKGEYIFLAPGHVLNLPPAPPLDASKNPYRGLQSFEEAHQELFFGRKALTHNLYEFFLKHPLTVVLGASGSGKSSLVKAGFIPHLRHGQTGQDWQILPPLRPGESPLKALSCALETIAPPIRSTAIAPVEPSDSMQPSIEALTAWLHHHPQSHLVLIIDQLEELITLCQNLQERHQFLDSLASLLKTHANQFHVLLTLRSDFEPQFRNIPLESDWVNGRFVVPAMTREELREAIEAPASARVIFFDPPDLVDQLIDEVANMPGALPLLSFALSELYLKYLQRQDQAKLRGETLDRAITQADYDELGGVTRSLTQRADQEYAALVAMDPAYTQTIRNVMLRMVAVGGELARRRVPESELCYPDPENSRVHHVIRQFLAARLIVTGTDVHQQTYFEPAHDALVRGWDKLLTWQQEQEEILILQRRLTPAATEWEMVKRHQESFKGIAGKTAIALNWFDRRLITVEHLAGQIITHITRRLQRSRPQSVNTRTKPHQFLWNTNPYLDVLNQELHSDHHWLNQIEAEFVQQSIVQKRRNSSWRWRIAIAVILGLSGLTIATLIGQRNALISQIHASRESAEANFRAGQSLNAFLDGLRAAHSLRHPLLQLLPPASHLEQQVEGTLQQAIYATQERNRLSQLSEHLGITRSQISPDGQLIGVATGDGRISLWNWQGQQQAQWAAAQGSVLNLSFSPDGQKVATAGSDGTVRLWTLQGKSLVSLVGHAGMVKGLSFSPDGQRLATSGTDKTVRLWNSQGQPLVVMSGHQKDVWSVVFHPDGQTLASAADDDTFRLWNLQGRLLQQVKADQGELHTIQFSPDGQRLATAGKDGRVRLWTAQGQPLAILAGHQGRVWRVTFSADSQHLASTAADGTVRFWTIAGQSIAILQGHQGPVRHVGLTPDGQRLVSSGDDATVRFWDLQGQQSVTLSGHQGTIQALQFHPDGNQLVTGGDDGTIRRWTMQGQPLTIAQGEADDVSAIALSRDGQRLASAHGQTIRLWPKPGQPPMQLQGHPTLIRSVEFSPDDLQLVSAGDEGWIYLWNAQGQMVTNWRAGNAPVWQIAFSPNGQQFATAGGDGLVQLWDGQGQRSATFEGHLGPVYSVAFSPDGQVLASAGQDGTIRLWRLQGNRKDGLFQVYEAEVNAIAFSPDGQRLISGDNRGRVHLWNLQLHQQAAVWRAHTNASIRQVEFSRDGGLIATTSEDGTAKLWRLEKFAQLRARSCAMLMDYFAYRQQNPDQGVNASDRDLCNL
ncbi:MAG: caspase family protein [Leptolyngbyaceae cyanobacterium bins.349]|nr:caspase family protein [Leptolyngbyaceae cyanobacterium bins.349]